jgi:hypothetical protein
MPPRKSAAIVIEDDPVSPKLGQATNPGLTSRLPRVGASIATGSEWAHMPDGCSAETTRAQTCGFRAFVGKTSMDFSLSALRFIVAVCSFFGFNVRVLDSLMNAPRISRPWRLRRNCTDVESKLYVLTANPARVAKLRHKEWPRPAEKRRFTMRS